MGNVRSETDAPSARSFATFTAALPVVPMFSLMLLSSTTTSAPPSAYSAPP